MTIGTEALTSPFQGLFFITSQHVNKFTCYGFPWQAQRSQSPLLQAAP